jgi:hypothetical protein
VRKNTARPITMAQGTNQLVGRDRGMKLSGMKLRNAAAEILREDSARRRGKGATIPPAGGRMHPRIIVQDARGK